MLSSNYKLLRGVDFMITKNDINELYSRLSKYGDQLFQEDNCDCMTYDEFFEEYGLNPSLPTVLANETSAH